MTRKNETTTHEEGPRAFARVLEGLNDGEAHRDLSEERFELVGKLQNEALARDAEVKGELTFKLKLKADARGRVHTSYEVKTSPPARKTSAGIMYMTKAGNLSVENERQPVLPGIRAVGPAREIGEVAEKTGVPLFHGTPER
jgi:hypothetical protein